MRELTTQDLIDAEKQASKIWHKFTDHGAQINSPWLLEYQKICAEKLKLLGQKSDKKLRCKND